MSRIFFSRFFFLLSLFFYSSRVGWRGYTFSPRRHSPRLVRGVLESHVTIYTRRRRHRRRGERERGCVCLRTRNAKLMDGEKEICLSVYICRITSSSRTSVSTYYCHGGKRKMRERERVSTNLRQLPRSFSSKLTRSSL